MVEVNYFYCDRSCLTEENKLPSCCATGDYEVLVEATIGDCYRAFKYDNPEGKSFAEIFYQRFEFYVHQPVLGQHPSLTYEPETHIGIASRSPCYYLDGINCRVHGSILKYIVCTLLPEKYLLCGPLDESQLNPEICPFPCVRGKILDDITKERAQKLQAVEEVERDITREIFEQESLISLVGKGCNIARPTPLSSLKNKRLAKELESIVANFNTKKNRDWEYEIDRLTENYARIIGYNL